jgi:hypothetical protein
MLVTYPAADTLPVGGSLLARGQYNLYITGAAASAIASKLPPTKTCASRQISD